jgi:hypothetical protein
MRLLILVIASSLPCATVAAEPTDLKSALATPILAPNTTQQEAAALVRSRIAPMPEPTSVADWERYAQRVRQDVLDNVVFRGDITRAWRDAPLSVEWLETLDGGPGYRLKKLRYQALPGLWIPALLYEPTTINGKAPVFLNVNGHDRKGKAADYKQLRSINMAKRGILTLNVEWLGMGQLNTPNYAHSRMNQLDLCGQSGLAVFFLAMQRGLDVLLSLDAADPARVGVSGLSGGGWQTIILTSLDERVMLSNPVAGYSSFLTRAEYGSDLGDSEQTPTDLGKYGDYLQLTAIRAPRPTLLTYNAKDQCCFASGHALPPLLAAAEPIYKLYGRETALASHVNHDPGTHNFEVDNRQALYRMIGAHFFPNDASYPADEIPSQDEVKSADDLNVALPAVNESFHSLALTIAKDLPRNANLPRDRAAAEAWRTAGRQRLVDVLRHRPQALEVGQSEESRVDDVLITRRTLRLGSQWSIPVWEMSRGEPKQTTVVLHDKGHAEALSTVESLLAEGHKVVLADVFYFGDCAFDKRAYLWALIVATVGDRPLGVQAGQLAAVVQHAKATSPGPLRLRAVGSRASVIGLCAATLVPDGTLAGISLESPLASLKQVVEENRTYDQSPELFCFGLLEQFDVKQLAALAAPTPLTILRADDRAKNEWASLADWYGLWNATAPAWND